MAIQKVTKFDRNHPFVFNELPVIHNDKIAQIIIQVNTVLL